MPSDTSQSQANSTPPWAAGTDGRHHELNPELNDAEIETVLSYGREVDFNDGDWLWHIGDRNADFVLVMKGALEIVRRDEDGEHVIITHERGHYGGEIVTMSGRGTLVAGRAKGELRAAVLNTTEVRDLLALEAELGERVLLSFILRRMRMIAEHLGDVILVGDVKKSHTASIREFLSRNGVPFDVVSDSDPNQQTRRNSLKAETGPYPILICGHRRLEQPSIKSVADCLGLSSEIKSGDSFDVAVVGAGPAGLAAAVYAASEGLKVVVLEKCAVGGQAGSSSRIENYLGFPTGISGQALTGRGFLQAQKFGAEIAIAREAAAIERGTPFHTLVLENGDQLRARTVVIASGAIYRQPSIEDLEPYESSSIHYGASHIQGMVCKNKEVAIVGGGNSAGQAAVYLSKHAKKVSIMIRGASLATSMSDYLIRRINKIHNIKVLAHTEVREVHGDDGVMNAILIENNQTKSTHSLDMDHLFIFIGAKPANSFINDTILADDKGFIKAGDVLSSEDLKQVNWPLERRPYLAETSCPRIFVAGDIRSGSTKRVASAVGEGSVCVQFIHRVLEELNASSQ